MKITKQSSFTGIYHTREIDVTDQMLYDWRERGGLIQNVMPHLSAGDREFLMTGITPEEWDSVFKRSEEN